MAAMARPATMLRAIRCPLCPVVRCRDPDHGKVIGMSKSKDTKKEQKKAPQKTAKEKKQAKRDKQGKSSSVLSKTAGS